MKIRSGLTVITISAVAFQNAYCDNVVLTIQSPPPATKSVSLTGISTEADKLKAAVDAKAQTYAEKMVIDTTALQEFINGLAEEYGWGAPIIAEKFNKTLEEGQNQINEKIPTMVTGLTSGITGQIAAAVKEFDAKGKFQADYKYRQDEPENNEWSGGACNREGICCGVAVNGTGTVGFQGGIAAGLNATVDFSITMSLNGSLLVNDKFNPVRPTTGTGETITITATPLYTTTIGGSVGAAAFMSATLGVAITGGGTLPDVQGTLILPE